MSKDLLLLHFWLVIVKFIFSKPIVVLCCKLFINVYCYFIVPC